MVGGVEMEYDAAAEEVFRGAKAAYDAGDCPRATEGFERFLDAFEDSEHAAEAHHLLARCLDRLGEHDRAMEVYQRLVERHPDSEYAPLARLELGLDHLVKEAYAEAAAVLEPAFDALEGPRKLEAARALAQASLGLERFSEAVRWLSELMRVAREPAERESAQAALVDLVDGRIPPLGLAKLKEELDPDSPAYPLVLFKLAKLHFHLGEFDRAGALARAYLDRLA